MKILDVYGKLGEKLATANKKTFFLYHSVEDGLKFLQDDFGTNKIAKIMVEVC